MMMNCETAAELLPWLLNGTLEAGERRQVVEHVRGCPACRAALADTRAAWEIFDWHPGAAALLDYARGGEGEAAAAAGAAGSRQLVAEHLAACPRCAAELELARTSRRLVEDERIAILRRDDARASRAWRRSALAAGVVGLLAATGWFESARQSRDLERRLAARAAQAAAPVNAAPRAAAATPASRPNAGEAGLRGRAAETEARVAALAAQNQQLQQRVGELGRTAAELGRRAAQLPAPPPGIESDILVADVTPVEQIERGAGEPAPVVVPLSSGTATLVLHSRHRATYPAYEIEIRDAQDRPVGKPVGVAPQPGGPDAFEDFNLTLRRGVLAPGAYTFHLFGRAAHRPGAAAGAPESRRQALETYAIRVS